MSAPNVPTGVARLSDPGRTRYRTRLFSPADFVLAEIRYIVTAEHGGRDTPPDPVHWNVSEREAERLRKIAVEYVDAIADSLE